MRGLRLTRVRGVPGAGTGKAQDVGELGGGHATCKGVAFLDLR